MSKQTIEKIIKVFIYLSFFIPLVVLPSSFIFPFIVPKILLFRTAALIMLTGYVILLIINWQEYKPKFSPVNMAVAAFFLSFTVSTFAGVDPYHSFWDNHERMLGLFTIFHFIAYYLVCTSVLKTWTEWKNALRIFLFAGGIVMFIGVLQKFNPDMLLNQGSDRVASTLGNSIYVGGYGLFLTFVAFLLFIRDRDNFWRWIYGVLGILAILGMFFSGTRGSMLGLGAGIAVAIIGYVLVLKGRPKTKKFLIGLAIFGVVACFFLYAFRKTSFVTNMPAIGRTFNTSLSDVEASPRWIAWGIAFQSWKERPVFGWGPNNFFYAFNKYYNPKSLEFGYGETWFDNAHNILMNTLSVQGAFGLLTYLSIFVLAIWSLILGYRKGQSNYHLVVVGCAFLIAHLVQNVTVFEDPTSYLYFMFWLAMVNRLSDVKKEIKPVKTGSSEKTDVKLDRHIGWGPVITIGAVALFLIFLFDFQPARANMMTLDTLKTLSVQPGLMAVDQMKAALAFSSPHIDDIRSDIGRTVIQVLGTPNNQLDNTTQVQLFDTIYPELQKNLVLHPLDIRNQLSLFQLAQIGYSLKKDVKYAIDAGTDLEDALKYSPKRQQIIYNLSNYDLEIGKSQDAITLLQSTIDADPKISEGYWRLAYTYRLLGNMAKAKETLALAQTNGIVFSDQEKSIVQQILAPMPATTTKPAVTKKR